MLVCGAVNNFKHLIRLKSRLRIGSVLSRNLGVIFEQKVRFEGTAHSLTLSLTHSLTLTLSLTHSLTHTHSFTHLLTLTHSLTHSFRSLTHSPAPTHYFLFNLWQGCCGPGLPALLPEFTLSTLRCGCGWLGWVGD
jgi:hypothetical protein